jgi:hypothetical protein
LDLNTQERKQLSSKFQYALSSSGTEAAKQAWQEANSQSKGLQ